MTKNIYAYIHKKLKKEGQHTSAPFATLSLWRSSCLNIGISHWKTRTSRPLTRITWQRCLFTIASPLRTLWLRCIVLLIVCQLRLSCAQCWCRTLQIFVHKPVLILFCFVLFFLPVYFIKCGIFSANHFICQEVNLIHLQSPGHGSSFSYGLLLMLFKRWRNTTPDSQMAACAAHKGRLVLSW